MVQNRRGTLGILLSLFRMSAVPIILFGIASCGDTPDIQLDYPLPFKTTKNQLSVYDGSDYKPLFIKGINLGVGVPGTQAGELAASAEQYRRWFQQMSDMGFNTIRTYTLHYPRFYDEFAAYNRANPQQPLYLLHGIWLDEENEAHSLNLNSYSDSFDAGIEEAVNCAHGNCEIAHRYGRAHGQFTTDISQWILGWVIGREIFPEEVAETNGAASAKSSFSGDHLKLADGTATEVWVAERLNKLIAFEQEAYGQDRPASLSSWPTLDPLTHPTESQTNSSEDSEMVDVMKFEIVDAPGGIFATFHAYPYYPDFINEDPNYRKGKDDQGPNSYLSYIQELQAHHDGMPLIIAEVGVPSSWGSAHPSFSQMPHGGMSETVQAESNARLTENIYESGCGGAILFAWIDEWWKRTWIVDKLSMPRDRFRLWPNVTSPEENFGIIAFDLGKPDYEKGKSATGTEALKSVAVTVNAAFLWIKLELKADIDTTKKITVGIDTYDAKLGESILPNEINTSLASEFSLVIDGSDNAQLFVTQAYDLFGIWHGLSTEEQLFHSISTDGGAWNKVRWLNNLAHQSDDGKYSFPESIDPVGTFPVSRKAEFTSSKDAVAINGSSVEIRIPWTLLNVVDPSTRTVFNDDRQTSEVETKVSDGVAVVVAYDGIQLSTERLAWEGWDVAPPTTERLKNGMTSLEQTLKALPNSL
jgi:hypothetical protein